jgi:hypothetical protein
MSKSRDYEIVQGRVRDAVLDHVAKPTGVAVVKAPPGSGKTLLLCELVARLKKSARVAVATQTNTQANDLCVRLANEGHSPYRFVASGASVAGLPSTVTVISKGTELPPGRSVVVATTKKWGAIGAVQPFDVLLVDEAWQMPWATFMPLSRVAGRFVLIGDPGQIPPTVTVETSRWETSPFAPHRPAPEVVFGIPGVAPFQAALPASRRLPYDTVQLLQPFYDFSFGAWARPEDRGITIDRRGRGKLDAALDLLCCGSMMALTLPTADFIPEVDDELVGLTVDAVARLLGRGTQVRIADQSDGPVRRVSAPHIGISSSHRSTNEALSRRLAANGLADVRVDTPERWQGLQCDVMFVVHPLSGVLSPSAFDLETGRLCVMASRHRGGLVIVSRDHVGATLEETLPVADQAVGREDTSGRGLEQHLRLWGALNRTGRIVAL